MLTCIPDNKTRFMGCTTALGFSGTAGTFSLIRDEGAIYGAMPGIGFGGGRDRDKKMPLPNGSGIKL